jgi:hypothetical protein
MLSVSWAVPCPLVLPCLSERDEWPTTSVSGVLGTTNTRIFRCSSPGTFHPEWRLFLSYFLLALHFLKPVRDSRSYLRSALNSRYIWKNTVVFLPLALRQRTRTRFSFQGTTRLFFLQGQEVEMHGLKPRAPNHGLKSRGLRRLKPNSVNNEPHPMTSISLTKLVNNVIFSWRSLTKLVNKLISVIYERAHNGSYTAFVAG